MTREDYCGAVLAALHRVTGRERAAIRAELDGHIEDHLEGLLDLGYPPDLAEERTLAAMGDPAEVGRELDRQYPLRWLAAKWAAQTAAAVLLVLLLLPMGRTAAIANNNHAASLSASALSPFPALSSYHWLDEEPREVQVGSAVLRVYEVCLTDGPDGTCLAEVRTCQFNRDIWRETPDLLARDRADIRSSSGKRLWEKELDDSRAGVRFSWFRVPVAPGDSVEIDYHWGGEAFLLELPLDWGDLA